MGRLSQAMAFIELPPEKLTSNWKQHNLTKIDSSDVGLLRLRKERLKEKQITEKLENKKL